MHNPQIWGRGKKGLSVVRASVVGGTKILLDVGIPYSFTWYYKPSYGAIIFTQPTYRRHNIRHLFIDSLV